MSGLKQWAAYVGAALVFGGVCFLAGHFLWRDAPPHPSTSSGSFQTPVLEKPSTPEVPIGKKPEDFLGKLTVIVRDTVKITDTVGTVHEHEITLLIPKDDSPPLVSPVSVEAHYSELPVPVAETDLGLLVGASIGTTGKPSPYGGVRVFRLFRTIEIGAGVNKEGLGPFLGYEFFREFNILVQYNVARWKDSKFALGIAYRF